MSNSVIFAAAGNGKTYSICCRAKEALKTSDKYVLLISYTNEGVRTLKNEYEKQNQGILDSRIIIRSWYSFVLNDFIRPYQRLLKLKYKEGQNEYPVRLPSHLIRSIAFYQTGEPPRGFGKGHMQYFLNSAYDVIPDRASMLAYKCNEDSSGKVIQRMGEIYSHIFIDELQDYAGWDLEIFHLLFKSHIQVNCVGDHKQATYRTNNSNKNKQYRDENIRNFFIKEQKTGLCHLEYATSTRRFNREICDYVNLIHLDKESAVYPDETRASMKAEENEGVYIIDVRNIEAYCRYYKPMVLRWDKKTVVDFSDDFHVLNYGASKGATFERVVIIPTKTLTPFVNNFTSIDAKQTKAKFYVACTRARTSVVFVLSNPKPCSRYQLISLRLGNNSIPAYKFAEMESGLWYNNRHRAVISNRYEQYRSQGAEHNGI